MSYLRVSLEGANLRRLLLAVLAGGFGEGNGLTLVEALEALALDLGEVHEQIVATLTLDEAVTLVRVEPLDLAFCHSNPSSRPCGAKQNDVTVAARLRRATSQFCEPLW